MDHLTARQAAEAFGVDLRTIERWTAAGLLPGAWKTPTGRIRVPPATAEAAPNLEGLVPSQLNAASVLGEAYAGPRGAGATASQIEQTILQSESQAQLVPHVTGTQMAQVFDQGVGKGLGPNGTGTGWDIAAQVVSEKTGSPMSTEQFRTSALGGLTSISPQLWNDILQAIATNPKTQANAAADLNTPGGQFQQLLNKAGVGMTGVGGALGSAALPLTQAMNNPSLGSMAQAALAGIRSDSMPFPLLGLPPSVLANPLGFAGDMGNSPPGCDSRSRNDGAGGCTSRRSLGRTPALPRCSRSAPGSPADTSAS